MQPCASGSVKSHRPQADARAKRLLSDAEGRLAQIRMERDAVAGYFESLRSVLTQAESITSDDK